MLVRQMEEKKLGYKFVFRHLPKSLTVEDMQILQKEAEDNHYVIIALLGYMDNCIFFGEDHGQLVEIAQLFDTFLQSYGMSVNAPKCFQICMMPDDPDFVPPSISMHHLDGSLQQIRTLKSTDPFTYLGVNCSLELIDWSFLYPLAEAAFEEARL